ncbi:vacuolar protein sorting-associated protein 33B isoform X3 [Mustela putorius furo]|uniref:Vacuolar protein sorting-associated protein 33B isoform X3 n=1 Tax=Mustela putorius furo TaxID=9669 RepID=A0A8U0UPG7_MUSPF|nr:vacuolar protein sorting-associated protein 33B isoform X3 [Mustela putorius furo]
MLSAGRAHGTSGSSRKSLVSPAGGGVFSARREICGRRQGFWLLEEWTREGRVGPAAADLDEGPPRPRLPDREVAIHSRAGARAPSGALFEPCPGLQERRPALTPGSCRPFRSGGRRPSSTSPLRCPLPWLSPIGRTPRSCLISPCSRGWLVTSSSIYWSRLCFLVRPRIKNMRYVASLVNADKLAGRTRKYKVIFSPQKFHACEMVLEEEGVYGDVSCDEWAFSLLPLDVDLLSMELPEFFRDYFLEGDQRWINTVAQALHLLSTLYGPFPNCYGIGRCTKMSYELWRKLEEEEDGETKGRRPEIGHVFLLDRDVDFVTALCSQVVYEGLVDDTFRVKCGSVDFGPEVTSSDRSLKVLLNAEDKVFNEIRNEHFSNVFGFLSQKARNLQAQYDRRRGMDIKQMKNFVSQELKGLKQEHRLLSVHIGACESIMKKKTKQDFQELIKTEHALLEGFNIRESTSYIEEHIDRQVSPIESLRLMCLLSITENGLIPKDYRSLKTQYLQSYGPEHLLTFSNLRRAGLLTEQAPGDTLTAVESKVSKLVTDKAAGS